MMNDLHNVALDIMGECSVGKGFGQTNPTKDIDIDFDKSTWERIPSAIFNGMTKRYQFVYVKRFLRRLGYEVEFDWQKEMISIRPDLLQRLIDEGQNPATSMKMSARDVVDQMSEILLAGSETTSGTIACFFLEIMRNKSVKEKLLKSLPILGPEDPIISSKIVRNGTQYEYLEACVKETLRIHPIASEIGRRTGTEPIELMGHLIPPHTFVSASYRELHRNPTHWPEPMRFWPERWLKNRPEGVPPPEYVAEFLTMKAHAEYLSLQAYYPFSAGKHFCVGINFA
ncbi:hypothetical protein BOTCAL_0073g00010 [Botryotinia calthae]|uniref:Cytochrome P450 n=1 Tax=Botryotinia calthae TaxID=38488 RepID=A0A4Y8D8K6_9HELO|nr:hypothetical protein BOTCAL_0073g00010 [Botryotinia calthae]